MLIVGGGGREHAIAWKLKRDDPSIELLAAPGNPGIAALARKRGWLVENFEQSDGAPRKPIPIGPMRHRFGGGLANPMIPGRTA